MSFGNPIVGGQGTLIRDSIRSRNYVPGVSGWSINRDGSAEFSNLVITGGEVFISDPDGSYVRIFDENPGLGAIIELNPADEVGHTYTPGLIRGARDADGPLLELLSPSRDGNLTSLVGIYGADEPGAAGIAQVIFDTEWLLSINTELVTFEASDFVWFDTADFQIGQSGNDTLLQLDDKVLGAFGWGAVNDRAIAGTRASATFAIVGGSASGTYTKANTQTRTRVFGTMTMFSTAINTTAEVGVRFNNGAGTVVDVVLCLAQITPSGSRMNGFTGVAEVSNATLPADTYTTNMIWRRVAGAGTLTVDANDSLSFEYEEKREA